MKIRRGSEGGLNLHRSSHFLRYGLLASAWSTPDSDKMVLKNIATLWKNQNTKPPISKILQKDTYFSFILLGGVGGYLVKQIHHQMHQGKVHRNLFLWLDTVLTDCTLTLKV